MKVKLVNKETSEVLRIEEAVEFKAAEASADHGKAGIVRMIAPEGTEYQAATPEETAEYAEANGVTFDAAPANTKGK